MIQDIEHLRPELDRHRFRHLDILQHSEVPIHVARTNCDVPSLSAKLSRVGDGIQLLEGTCIEPGIDRVRAVVWITYEVRTLGAGNSSIVIQNHETSAAAMSIAGREQPRNTSAKLVFHRVGNSYFLAEVWRSSTAEGMIVPTSKQEKDLEKELQASNAKGGYEEVVVALN